MLLLRGYEKWHGISFLGDHFSVVARGRKLYVIVLVCVVSAFVVLWRYVFVCGRQHMFLLLCINLLFCREVTDALAEVTDLDADIPQEGAAFPSSHDYDCFWIHFGQIEFHGKPWPKVVGAYLFVWKFQSLLEKGEYAWPQVFGFHVRGDCCFLMLYPERVHCCLTHYS